MINQTPWEQIQDKLQNPQKPEDELLKKWLEEDAENREVFGDLQVIYSITGNIPESFITQKEQAWQKIVKRILPRKNAIKIIRISQRIAASILLVALGIGAGLFLKNNYSDNLYTEVYSPYGHKTMILLPDSSQVWLNGDTKLKYCSNFNSSRNIELVGEALFKVSKSPNKLFTINSRSLQLEVYGTTFNVKSYPDDVVSEVALVEGSIGLFHNKQLLKNMIPGDVITYNYQKKKYCCRQGDVGYITAWSGDELVVENETFENVIKYLERWYGVKINLDESLKQDLKLSFKVKTESLNELLAIINHITPINYEINGKQVNLHR